MTLLRDERLTELNELMARCDDAAVQYRDGADWAPDAGLAAVLGELARQRQAAGGELSHYIRTLGDRPDALDADRESLNRIGVFLSSAVFHDPRTVSNRLARHAARLERGIAEQAERVLATGISGPVRDSVQRLRDSAEGGARRLER